MKQTITKDGLITAITNDTGYPRNMVRIIIDSMLTNITWFLSIGRKVQFSGFGAFEAKKRAARTGRNPHTNEAVPIPARTMPVFTAGEHLKDAVSKQQK